jgi:D-alanyl-D-alanine carboxypeptidase (penicillin-binding protein 5/6)
MHGRTSYCLLTGSLDKRHPKSLLYGVFVLTLLFQSTLSDSYGQTIRSRAVAVMDASTGQILYTKDSNRLLPPASTAKLMTAIVTLENETLSNVVTISTNASAVHPSKAGFKEGDQMTVEGLLYAALLKSANDAAVALAEAVAGTEEHFVHLMNRKAISIGATNTRFINSTGLPGPGQHTTALDLSAIMRYAMRYPKLREIIGTPEAQVSTEEGRAVLLKNTDKLLWSDKHVIGGKTGYTDSAKHCFVGAAERGKKLIIVSILGSPSRKTLWEETRKLIAKGFGKI